MQLDNTPKSNGLYTQTADFLAALFRDAPDEQYLEYRIFHPGWREQIYTPIAELRANGFISTLPTHYDGQFNVYYGVSPRTRHEGTGKAVDTALAVWFDEWTQPADVPPISWLEETSPGKVQGGYFLDRPTNGPDELRRVERLSQRLIQAVGGDKGVWDRPRILRVPGFLNVKKEHPEHPRAFLLEFNPDLRYSLEELEAALPELAVEDQDRPLREHTGPFNIHMGTPLAEADQERLPQGLQDLGLSLNSDGRYGGACPLPHKDGACECESAFYISPKTGNWWCFCSDHVGKTNGGISALRLIGFECEHAIGGELSLKEMAELLGAEIAEGFFKEGVKPDIPDTNVGVLVKGKNHLYPKSDKRRKKGDTLWSQALEHFPLLRGVKPVGRSNIGVNEHNQTYHAWDSYSNTWRNPQNANNKRRQTYLGLVPILNGAGPWFTRAIPLDDLGDDEKIKKRHEALLTAVKRKREDGQCFSIDNLVAKGVLAYIANAPLKGFEPIDAPVAWLVSSLKAIRPPRHDEDQEHAFRPIKGSYQIRVAMEKPVDENQNRLKLIARSTKATDFLMVEATAQTMGIESEYSSERLFRSQCSDYSLRGEYRNIDQVLRLAEGLEGYELTKFAREAMADVRIGHVPKVTNLAGAAV